MRCCILAVTEDVELDSLPSAGVDALTIGCEIDRRRKSRQPARQGRYLQHALLTAPATVIDRGALARKLLDELGGKDHRARRCVSASLCRALQLLERDGYVMREGRFTG